MKEIMASSEIAHNTLHKIHHGLYAQKSLNLFTHVRIAISCVFILLVFSSNSFASNPEYFNKVVSAIYKAEGGSHATYLYGIRSIPYSSPAEAKKICYNTVRNNYRRWLKSDQKLSYLEFLSRRYCPIGADNDNGTNKYWLRNVTFFLTEGDSHGSRVLGLRNS